MEAKRPTLLGKPTLDKDKSASTQLKSELVDAIRQNYSPHSHGVIYNFSGHAVPDNFKYHLGELGIRTFSKFQAPCHITQDDNLWNDCHQLISDLSEMTCPILGKNSLECPGKAFLFLPANSGAASLLLVAMNRLLVIPPYLVRVRRDFASSEFVVDSIINLQTWDGYMRRKRCSFHKGASADIVDVMEVPSSRVSANVIKLRSKS